ncbi:hypothetical protein IJS18_02645 [Candidatus Saccharibacteria bacterium]|nr:hypothetical protein [Candidatus Saccharibacteria bacterium]
MRRGTVRSGLGASSVIFIVFIVLAVCLTVGVAVLIGAGVISFDGNGGQSGGDSGSIITPDDSENLINNPNPRITRNAQFFEILNLEFYLPFEFKNVINNKKGVYEIKLQNDEGKAEVVVYVERATMKADKYLKRKDSSLVVTNTDYTINGTTWVEASSTSTLAYATNFGTLIYAIFCNVEMDSAATANAMEMIPKTLYMKKLYR